MDLHISQQDLRELEDIAAAFMVMVHLMVTGAGRDQDYIIKMDQSTIPLTFDRQRT